MKVLLGEQRRFCLNLFCSPLNKINMKIVKGRTRRVFIFKNVVIKVARIYFWKAVKTIKFRLFLDLKVIAREKKNYRHFMMKRKKERKQDRLRDEEHRIKQEQLMGIRYPHPRLYECYGTASIFFFGGIMANRQERKFYKKTKNIFVMPTYFSFLGLFNIQKRGEKITFWDDKGVWFYIHDNCQNHEQPFCDGHTLSNIDNYCLDNEHLKIVDYGSRYVGHFLELNGKTLYANFKIPE